MPRGSKPGERRGGRRRGVPNKVTSAARHAFLATFGQLEGDLQEWIRQTAEGFEAVHFLADGTAIPYLEKNPAKAADLLIRMAEYHFPKLGRTEVTGAEGGPLEVVIRDIAKDGA